MVGIVKMPFASPESLWLDRRGMIECTTHPSTNMNSHYIMGIRPQLLGLQQQALDYLWHHGSLESYRPVTSSHLAFCIL